MVASPLLEVREIRKYFPVRRRALLSIGSDTLRAVDDVSFSIATSETVSLVGESGCGKTTTARLILGLETPTSGSIVFQGQDITRLKSHQLRRIRPSIQAVFQDPWSSLSPRMRARDIICEPFIENRKASRSEVADRVTELLLAVGLKESDGAKFPHEFSGGQRQRIAIARALILRPPLIVLDEPVSSLDVSIRAQVINLFKDLQELSGAAYFLIAHDLATVRYLSHRVAVMYLGEIVETGSASEVLEDPLHPYTKALVSAATPARPNQPHEEIILSGEVPSAITPPPGCRFHPRCPFAFDRCRTERPSPRTLGRGRTAACHLY